MDSCGTSTLLANCSSGKKRGLCVHHSASRGGIPRRNSRLHDETKWIQSDSHGSMSDEKCHANRHFSSDGLGTHFRIRAHGRI